MSDILQNLGCELWGLRREDKKEDWCSDGKRYNSIKQAGYMTHYREAQIKRGREGPHPAPLFGAQCPRALLPLLQLTDAGLRAHRIDAALKQRLRHAQLRGQICLARSGGGARAGCRRRRSKGRGPRAAGGRGRVVAELDGVAIARHRCMGAGAVRAADEEPAGGEEAGDTCDDSECDATMRPTGVWCCLSDFRGSRAAGGRGRIVPQLDGVAIARHRRGATGGGDWLDIGFVLKENDFLGPECRTWVVSPAEVTDPNFPEADNGLKDRIFEAEMLPKDRIFEPEIGHFWRTTLGRSFTGPHRFRSEERKPKDSLGSNAELGVLMGQQYCFEPEDGDQRVGRDLRKNGREVRAEARTPLQFNRAKHRPGPPLSPPALISFLESRNIRGAWPHNFKFADPLGYEEQISDDGTRIQLVFWCILSFPLEPAGDCDCGTVLGLGKDSTAASRNSGMQVGIARFLLRSSITPVAGLPANEHATSAGQVRKILARECTWLILFSSSLAGNLTFTEAKQTTQNECRKYTGRENWFQLAIGVGRTQPAFEPGHTPEYRIQFRVVHSGAQR
ncbi:hypothetical protein C8R44DRAFT_752996 [Mycena epipterygia]|nr:hypothetical protein C8R44DRAFT_752996 [Mycena epipterygia]